MTGHRRGQGFRLPRQSKNGTGLPPVYRSPLAGTSLSPTAAVRRCRALRPRQAAESRGKVDSGTDSTLRAIHTGTRGT